MKIHVTSPRLFVKNMRLRMPFRFGITTLTECPHLFLTLRLHVDGREATGVAADMLANKWFTKDPATTYADDIVDMLKIIRMAGEIAVAQGNHDSVFDLWLAMYQAQESWAGGWGFPPLLAHLGSSLVERAMIDAFCRLHEAPLSKILRDNRLGIQLGRLQEELSGAKPADLLPPMPLRQMTCRHTVGLTDPLTDEQISDADRVVDGLPQSLQACIATYGLTHFKIKLWGDVERDAARVHEIARLIQQAAGNFYAYTFDGNENFKTVADFKAFWDALTGDAALGQFLSRMICVEQPLHRSVALSEQAMREFSAWHDRPPTIIDESDGTIASARKAMELGYAGTSHKNCKGIFKSIANACLIEHRRRTTPGRKYILTAEDLTNVGPVALMQDLSVAANLGITHVERNGHHYFKGLTMFPAAVQEAVLDAHPDLYHRHADGFAAVNIERGVMKVGSVVDHEFGVAADFDPAQFTPADEWTYESMMAGARQ